MLQQDIQDTLDIFFIDRTEPAGKFVTRLIDYFVVNIGRNFFECDIKRRQVVGISYNRNKIGNEIDRKNEVSESGNDEIFEIDEEDQALKNE